MKYKQKKIIGDCILYHADCTDIIPYLDDVDCCISDPPFEAEAHTIQRRVTRVGELKNESLPFSAITEDQRLIFGETIPKICKGWILVFCQIEAVVKWKEALEKGGAKYKRSCIWVKPDGMPQFSGDRPGMGYETIVTLWSGKGKSVWNGGGRKGVFTFNKQEARRKAPHPTTKPILLMKSLVSLFSNQGETVLDAYMGSGSTGVACVQSGREFIGIEINEEYFDIACNRIKEAYTQPDLFLGKDLKYPEQQEIDL